MDKNVLDTRFTKALFETINLASLVQIGALPSYNARDIEKIKILLPNINEQRNVGILFQRLDNLIASNQRKVEALKKMKQALLQKMFI